MSSASPIATAKSFVSGSVYDGIYARNSLTCDGSVPSPGPYNLTPDIIQSLTVVSDPQAMFSTPASWAQMYATEPSYGQRNYYYLRGLNGASGSESCVASLYQTPAQLILFPGAWKNNPLTTASGSETVAIASSAGAIAVGSGGFVWKAPPPPGGGSTFYSFVSQINDEKNSNPVPSITSWLDMAEILSQNLGFGFRNVCYVDSTAQNWTERLAIAIPSSIPAAGQVLLSIAASGLTGSTIGLIADTFLPSQGAILITPLQITQDSFLTGVKVLLPPGFSASLAVQWWSGSGSAPAPGSSIVVASSYMVPPQQFSEAAGRAVIDGRLSASLGRAVGVGPTPMSPLGSAAFIFGAPADV